MRTSLVYLIALCTALSISAGAETWTATLPYTVCSAKPTGATAATTYEWRDQAQVPEKIIPTGAQNYLVVGDGPGNPVVRVSVRARQANEIGPWSQVLEVVGIRPYGADLDANGSVSSTDYARAVSAFQAAFKAGAKSCAAGACPASCP